MVMVLILWLISIDFKEHKKKKRQKVDSYTLTRFLTPILTREPGKQEWSVPSAWKGIADVKPTHRYSSN